MRNLIATVLLATKVASQGLDYVDDDDEYYIYANE